MWHFEMPVFPINLLVNETMQGYSWRHKTVQRHTMHWQWVVCATYTITYTQVHIHTHR